MSVDNSLLLLESLNKGSPKKMYGYKAELLCGLDLQHTFRFKMYVFFIYVLRLEQCLFYNIKESANILEIRAGAIKLFQ